MPDTQGSGVFELSPARVSRAYDRMMAHRHTLALSPRRVWRLPGALDLTRNRPRAPRRSDFHPAPGGATAQPCTEGMIPGADHGPRS
jgi:hypothetical protein